MERRPLAHSSLEMSPKCMADIYDKIQHFPGFEKYTKFINKQCFLVELIWRIGQSVFKVYLVV